MMGRGRTGPGGTRQDGPGRDLTGRDGPGRDLTGRDGAGRDGASQTAGREVARPDRTARGVTVIVATACLGTAMMVVPALSLPERGQALTAAGLLLVAASLASPLARWRGTTTLAAVTAIAGSALGNPGTGLLAAEGLLILGYLLLTDAPAAMPGRVAARWLRLQAPAAAWAALASAAVLLGLGVQVRVSAWLVVAGAAAAVGATVIALPGRSRQPREPR
jgi:hypothetical protein